ncbi:MAG: carboxylesterase family protein [Syntrophales bacterium]|jgi:para-nitrobenzyl esterase|nr:carboxylesterase family protein [Syntrophales bacterium]
MKRKWKVFIGVSKITALTVIALGLVSFMGCGSGDDAPFLATTTAPAAIADPIQTDTGLVSGASTDTMELGFYDFTSVRHTFSRLVGEPGKAVRVYKGIPYAAPPVGDLRWKPPQPVTPWIGVRDCTEYGPMTPQKFPQSFFYDYVPESGMSEDCLYLNVVTPAKTTGDRLPVMVFFHGGGLTDGYSNSDSYNNPALPQHGMVLVTVNSRLNVIGFMAHPALTAESPNQASGNYGTLDLIAALQWVQKNIAAFGGDPNNITINGQSGGSGKCMFLLSSPLAKGLFHKAILQSLFFPIYRAGVNYGAGSYGGISLAAAEQNGVALAEKLGITDTGAAGLAALRAKTWQEIVTASHMDPAFVTNFTVDGWSLLDTIPNIFDAAKQHDVPLIAGVTGEEVEEAGRVSFFKLAFGLPGLGAQLTAMSSGKNSKFYTYVFTHVPDPWKAVGQFAPHAADLLYMLNTMEIFGKFPAAIVNPVTVPIDIGMPTAKDMWVSEFVMNAVVNFCKTGDPSVPAMGVNWPAFENTNQYYADIGYPVLVKTGFGSLNTWQPPR